MVKAIVFDFGDVLYKLNFDLFHKNLSAIAGYEIKYPYPEIMLQTFLDYSVGAISTESFIWKIQHNFNKEANPRNIVNSWLSLLDHFPSHQWDFLSELRKKYKVFLLSNINELHLNAIYKHMNHVHQKPNFEKDYFDSVFYSHHLNMRKPSKEIYEFVNKKIHFSPNEILFIDDMQNNIESAQSMGWNAVVHDPTKDIARVFPQYLNKFNVN